MQSCRTCTFFDIERAKNKAGAVLSSKSSRCNWALSEPVPTSVPLHNRTIKTNYVRSNDGTECPAYKRAEGSTQ